MTKEEAIQIIDSLDPAVMIKTTASNKQIREAIDMAVKALSKPSFPSDLNEAAQKSIEWQKANHPMVIGGDAFADMVDSFNVNPAFVAGYKEAEKDIWDRIEKYLKTRHHMDYATVGWILDNLEYYKQKIMEDQAALAWKIQSQIKEETK